MVEDVRSNFQHLGTQVDSPALSPSEPGRSPDVDTERVSPRYRDIDLWDSADILEALIEGQFVAVAAVRAARPALERAARAIEARLKRGGRLVYAGAGTSGRLAVQDGAELMPTFSWPDDRLLLLIAGGEEALLRPGRRTGCGCSPPAGRGGCSAGSGGRGTGPSTPRSWPVPRPPAPPTR